MLWIDLVFNLLIVLSTVLAVCAFFFTGPDALGSTGVQSFRYFTTDSNILAAAAAAVMAAQDLRALRGGTGLSRAALCFKLVGTVSVSVTLVTVVCFLVPMSGGNGLAFFRGNTFALHLSTPLLAIVSFLVLEQGEPLRFRVIFPALIPTVLYSAVYAYMVIGTGRWFDWYGFTFGGRYALAPAAVLAMYVLTFVLAWAEWWLRRRLMSRKQKQAA